jgi:FkbM family methyltransferase
MKKLRLSKARLAAVIVVVFYGVLVYGFPQVGLALGSFAASLGRTAPCGRIEALHGLARHILWVRGGDRIAASVRLVRNDPTGTGYHLLSTSRGQFWVPADSDEVLPILLSQQEQRIYGPLRSGDVVLDCGAHVGVYTREALRAGASLIVAIEPAPDNVECLRRNFAPEISAGRVIVYPKGVWNKEDTLVLHTVLGNSAGDSLIFKAPIGKGIEVPLTTVDILVAELKLPRVTMIKMDIKGAEKEALAGAANTLRTQKPRLAMATEHLPDDPERIAAIVHGFRPDYTTRCNDCSTKDGRVRPEVLLFE